MDANTVTHWSSSSGRRTTLNRAYKVNAIWCANNTPPRHLKSGMESEHPSNLVRNQTKLVLGLGLVRSCRKEFLTEAIVGFWDDFDLLVIYTSASQQDLYPSFSAFGIGDWGPFVMEACVVISYTLF